MRFAPAPEQLAFAAAVGELLAASDTPAVVRSWAAGDPAPGRKLWTRLAELGVLALGDTDSGATPVDLVLAFEQLGRYAVPGPYVESAAVLPALGVAADDAMATLAMPPHVPFALDGSVADAVYVVDGDVLATARVTGTAESVDRARLLAQVEPRDGVGRVAADTAFDRGVLATAAQLHGLGSSVLDQATAYAKQRVQFGKPIGSFQAVKHLLADAALGLALARPLLFGAALTRTPRDVSAAKIACTDAAYRAARVALQVHGAIGYTAEHDLALWLTKIRALTSVWGTQRFHRDRVLAALRCS